MTDTDRLAAGLAVRYRLEHQIGAGGMATVFLAHDLTNDRKVAIKVLRADLAAMLGTERFLREIGIASQLDHPHIVGLVDSGTVPAGPGETQAGLYYVMPYIDGESLRERMLREPQLPLDLTLNIARQVAEAIDYAHRNGLVHRDIKPENILLAGDQVYVTDFGIARAVGTAGGSKLTETGMTVGTPAYMSPEQSLSETIDNRSDIYALGCVVYEMLVGEPPYTGPTPQSIIARRLSEPLPSLRVVRDALPRSVELAVHRALARTPADRYATASQFVDALMAPPTDGVSGTRRRIGLIAVAMAAVLLSVGWFALRSAPIDSASVIAVLPFATAPAADTALERLGHGLVSTLTADLGQVSGIRTVNVDKVLGTGTNATLAAYGPAAREIGRRVGARSVLFGSLRGMAGGKVRIDLKLLAADSSADTLAVISTTGSIDSIHALTDSLTLGLLGKVWRHGTPPSPSLASITTRSLPALAAFFEGERLGVADRWADAALSYDAAFRLDTTFWLAAWRHNEAQQWIPGEPDQNDTLQAKYETHLASFGERDRLLISSEATMKTELFSSHLKRFQDVSERFPADWAAVWPYADHIMHSGPLVGKTDAEVLAALGRTVALNPRLTNAWQHLYARSLGRDSAKNDSAVHVLIGAGPGGQFEVVSRLAEMTDPDPTAAQFDSAVTLVATRAANRRGFALSILSAAGHPGRQLRLDQLLLVHTPRQPDSLAPLLASVASAWAVRGVWDSVMVAEDALATVSPSETPIDIYRMAVAGAWLQEFPLKDALARRAAAAQYAAAHTAGPSAKRDRGTLLWCDALVAILQLDADALASQRSALRSLLGTGDSAKVIDRTLGAFQLLLRKRNAQSADSLAVIDLGVTEAGLGHHDGFARSVDHLAGAQLLLQLGDTVRALKLLTWFSADFDDTSTFNWFAATGYLWQGRVADAQHRKTDAIYYYRQFLQRHDLPTPLLQANIDEARRALARLYGLAEPGRRP